MRIFVLLAPAVAAACCVPLASARAQSSGGVAPETSLLPQVGSLRQQIEDVVTPAATRREGWTVTPAIDLQEVWSDNVTRANGHRSSEFITNITPSLAVSGTSARLTGDLNYAPRVSLYPEDGRQNRVAQNLTASGEAELLPEELFVDVRGYAATSAQNGYYGTTGSTQLNRDNEIQTYDFSVAPKYVHKFASVAILNLGASMERFQSQTSNMATNSALYHQSSTTERGYGKLSTGEDFGRLLDALSVDASETQGSGVLTRSHRTTVSNDAEYAITRYLSVLGGIGYEDIRYSGTSSIVVNDMTWNTGIRLTADSDTTLLVQYGHHDGGNSVSADGSWAPTAKLRLYARYSEGLSTSAEDTAQLMSSTQATASGLLIDKATGMPVVSSSAYFSQQNSLTWLRSGSVSAALLEPRDTYSATVSHQERELRSAASLSVYGNTNSASNSTYGSLAWQHDLQPDLSSNLSAQYGVTDAHTTSGSNTDNDSLVLNTGLTYRLSETATLSLQYTYTQQWGHLYGTAPTSNIVLATAHKSF